MTNKYKRYNIKYIINLIKIKNFCSLRHPNKGKVQVTNWEELFVTHKTNKVLYASYTKN